MDSYTWQKVSPAVSQIVGIFAESRDLARARLRPSPAADFEGESSLARVNRESSRESVTYPQAPLQAVQHGGGGSRADLCSYKKLNQWRTASAYEGSCNNITTRLTITAAFTIS